MGWKKMVAAARALVSGQRGLGTTFWVGVFVVNSVAALGFVWLEFLAATLEDSGLYGPLRALITLFYLAGFLYNLLLLGGLWRSARATPEVGGWRWVGLGLGFACLLTYAGMIFLA